MKPLILLFALFFVSHFADAQVHSNTTMIWVNNSLAIKTVSVVNSFGFLSYSADVENWKIEKSIGRQSKIEINQFRGMYERTNDLSPADFREIFQKALDFPDFQQYYHADVDQTRKQLVIKYFGDANHDNLLGVTKFDRQVLIKTEEEIIEERIKDYFVLGDWLCGTNSVRMQLEYPIEGVTLSLRFEKVNDVWGISSHALSEE